MTDESKIENITKPTPEHIAIAKELYEDAQSFEELITKIRDVVHDNINKHPNTPYPKTLLESRFSPVDEQYSEGVGSCGAEVNIETDILGKYCSKLLNFGKEDKKKDSLLAQLTEMGF